MTQKVEAVIVPAVTPELCKALMDTQRQATEANLKYIEEKIKGVKTTIITTGAVITITLSLVDFAMRFIH